MSDNRFSRRHFLHIHLQSGLSSLHERNMSRKYPQPMATKPTKTKKKTGDNQLNEY